MLMKDDTITGTAPQEYIGCKCKPGLVKWNEDMDIPPTSPTPECVPKPDDNGSGDPDQEVPAPGCVKYIPGCNSCYPWGEEPYRIL